jgi:histidine phosphotransferase ChpT
VKEGVSFGALGRMEQSHEFRLIELLNARLCHDLISPVSAVNNGIELIGELGDDADGEALGLVAMSGKEAAQKLQFFRLAFGSARLPTGADAGMAEARAALLAWPVGERISLLWPQTAPSAVVPRAGTKIMMLAGLAALDCLGGAGQLSIDARDAAEGLLWTATGRGERAGLPADMASALSGQAGPQDLTPKTAPAAYAALLARAAGAQLAAAAAPGEVRLTCLFRP